MAKLHRPLMFCTDDKFTDVREELTRRGWSPCPSIKSPFFDLKWRNLQNIDFSRIRPDQYLNHFENAQLLSNKVSCIDL